MWNPLEPRYSNLFGQVTEGKALCCIKVSLTKADAVGSLQSVLTAAGRRKAAMPRFGEFKAEHPRFRAS